MIKTRSTRLRSSRTLPGHERAFRTARALGANTVLLETGAGAGAPRNSFYDCQSMPSGVFDYDR